MCLNLRFNIVYLTETDINTRLAWAWSAINRLSVIRKSDLADKMKCGGYVDTAVSMHDMDTNKTHGEKSLTATTQECCKQYWTSPGGSTPQSSSCTATYHPSRKLSKLEDPDMQDTAREVETNSLVTYSSGPLHMDEQRQDVLIGPTYNSSVLIQDVALKTYRKRWTIEKGGGRGSRRSVLIARHDDDDVLSVQIVCERHITSGHHTQSSILLMHDILH